jgi:hypothetical protein
LLNSSLPVVTTSKGLEIAVYYLLNEQYSSSAVARPGLLADANDQPCNRFRWPGFLLPERYNTWSSQQTDRARIRDPNSPYLAVVSRWPLISRNEDIISPFPAQSERG